MSLRHLRHLPSQLPVVVALGRTLLPRRARMSEAKLADTLDDARSSPPEIDAALAARHRALVQTIAPPHPALVRDYVEHVGGDPAAYRSTLPPHLFPHWCLPLAARTLAGLPYPLTRIVNAGCRLEALAPLPAHTPLIARASLVHVDDDGRRAVITQRLITGTSAIPDALVATLTTIVPLDRGSKRNRMLTASAAQKRASVPYDARELARWQFGRDAGLAFAILTGDFNPIHWLTRAGVVAGFGGPILHGFAMFARAIEGTVHSRFAGDASRVRVWDARFTRPLKLPADVGLFARGDEVWIGDAPGTAPYLAMRVAAPSTTASRGAR